MSMTVKDKPSVDIGAQDAVHEEASQPAHWKGFVAGVFSGVAKLTGVIHCRLSRYQCDTDWSQWGIRMSK
jgi:hypothetical protein